MELCTHCGKPGRLYTATFVWPNPGDLSHTGRFCSDHCYNLWADAIVARDDFPVHEHVWEVVLVQDNPVGVTCKICDHTVQMAEAVERRDPPRPVLDLDVGIPVKIVLSRQAIEVVVDQVQYSMGSDGNVHIDISFRSLDRYLDKAMGTFKQSINTNTITFDNNKIQNVNWMWKT